MTMEDCKAFWVLGYSEITLLSNTTARSFDEIKSFRLLWNYTTLKRQTSGGLEVIGFRLLWNYTTLKQEGFAEFSKFSF